MAAAFEEWPLPEHPFDAVVSATAFHWVDPAVRVAKAADALAPNGVLATVATHHVAGGSAGFFAAVQDCYERFHPAAPSLRLPVAAEIPLDSAELDVSGRFGRARFYRYEWEATYSTADYLDLLCTYSDHRAQEPAAREGLMDCIGALIDRHHGGRITKRYLTELRVARRKG